MLLLTHEGLHYTRSPLIHRVRLTECLWVWLWFWAWACVTLCVSQGVSVGQRATLQGLPIAAEDNYYSFNPDGTYTFSYDTGGGKHQSFRIEMRDASGKVSGRFGYVDPTGALRITEYQADSSGYRANIEVYHQVSLAPPAPLLVGPLPKHPASTPKPPEEPPQPLEMHRVGPAPFFPPPQPLLIIGPLPKPLQPDSSERDKDPADLDEDSLSTTPADLPIHITLPQSLPTDTLPRNDLNSPLNDKVVSNLQGSLTDFQVSTIHPHISPNSTLSAFGMSAQATGQQNVSVEPSVGAPGQARVPSTPHTSQQLPEAPQLLPTQEEEPATPLENDEVNSDKTNPDKQASNSISNPIVYATQENQDVDSMNTEPNYSLNGELLQPSATIITTSTVSRLAGRDTSEISPRVISASSVLATNDETKSQLRTFRNPPPPHPPPVTYLPVSAPHRQYPTAILLQLPEEDSSYPM